MSVLHSDFLAVRDRTVLIDGSTGCLPSPRPILLRQSSLKLATPQTHSHLLVKP